MRTLRRVALALVLAGAATSLPGCAVAQPVPVPYADPPVQWADELSPYGTWTSLPNYGTVWYPRVAPGWRPYLYGSWGWSPAGWAWFSTEPWGFTFNYGRWAWAPLGWVWVPGTVWGPAWVNWYWGNGYIGWAPLGYYGAVPWAQFVFIDDDDFGCHDTHKRYHKHPPKGGGYRHGPPPRQWVERIAREPIVRVSSSELPNRSLPPGVRRPEFGTRGPGNRPQGGGTVGGRPGGPQGRPPHASYDSPGGGSQGTPSFVNRPRPGNQTPPSVSQPPWNATPGRRPPAVPRQGYVPDVGRPTGQPPRGYVPNVRGPADGGPQGRGPNVGWPGNAPRTYAPQGRPPIGNAPGGSTPPPSQQPGRGGYAPPPAQAAPRMAPAPSAPAPSFSPRGQFSPAPSAPSGGFTGGGRGFGSGRGGGSPGMR